MIIIGNLNASKLIKTKMAKSTLDSGFSAFKTMLKYKCENAGVWFEEVDEIDFRVDDGEALYWICIRPLEIEDV